MSQNSEIKSVRTGPERSKVLSVRTGPVRTVQKNSMTVRSMNLQDGCISGPGIIWRKFARMGVINRAS